MKEINPEKIKNAILEMVKIPSPPGQEKEVAEFYAEYLREIGLAVELDYEFPESPSVIGRLKGTGKGPVLQFDGHLDTIVTPGPEIRFEDGFIYGRGTEDMKGDLICMAEAVRVIIDSGIKLPGDILLTAHGRHESGTNETLESLISKGVYGDAVIVTEGYTDRLPVVGLGLAIWEIRISREGEPTHENETPPGTPHPLMAGVRMVDLLREKKEELSKIEIEHIGHESIFIGKFQSGDYFNRMPNECVIAGSRRFGPDKTLDDISNEFNSMAEQVATESGAKVEAVLTGGLGSFKVDEDEHIVKVIRKAHGKIFENDLPSYGMRTAGNLSNFANSAKIPGVYYGIQLNTAHSDNERIKLDDAVKVTKVFVQAIQEYFK